MLSNNEWLFVVIYLKIFGIQLYILTAQYTLGWVVFTTVRPERYVIKAIMENSRNVTRITYGYQVVSNKLFVEIYLQISGIHFDCSVHVGLGCLHNSQTRKICHQSNHGEFLQCNSYNVWLSNTLKCQIEGRARI